MSAETRPFSAAGWAMLHRIADDDRDVRNRLAGYFRDPDDEAGERWEFLRVAVTNAWKTVELPLLRRMSERRFNDGELDAWVRTTPLGQEIRDGIESLFESYRSVMFPPEPKSFGAFAFQELRVARLAGELSAELSDPANNAVEVMERLATRLEGRFPLLALGIRQPEVDIAAMAWFYMD